MPVRKRRVPLGDLQKTRGGERFVPDVSVPLRCYECNRLMDSTFSIEGRCPNCKRKYSKQEWAKMAAEALQVKSQGGWNRDKLERFEDEKTGTAAYIAPDGTTHEQNDVARKMAEWAIRQKRRNEALQRVKKLGGSHVSQFLGQNPFR